VAVLGERCPLLLDAMDPGIKQAEAPWLARLVEERAAWEEASAEADRRIGERGHPLQVHPQRASSPLFELRGGERRRIEWADGGGEGYHLRGAEGGGRPLADLLATIEDNPSVVSPGVLARPAIQDALLGTTLQVLGPGEVSYMAQAAPAYRVLGVAAPWIALRPQVLVLEGHHREKLEEMGLPLAALLGPEDELDRRLAGENGAGFVERTRDELSAALAALGEEATAFDPNLERPFEKTREHVLRSLDTFAGKVIAAAARRDEVRAGRVERLRQVCLPGGALQERVVSSSHFPGKYGERFVEALREQMDLDGRHLQVIEP
jgi:bacillithiol synthase